MLTNTQLNEITQKMVAEFKKIFGSKLNSIILFGSYARGDYDDFYIVSKDEAMLQV